jgi:mannose-6-phosphate isomerase-like protein (cupin superfamily)
MNQEIFIDNIEKTTIENNYYRKVLYTSPTNKQQLVVMSIKAGEDIPYEIHNENDQFIRIEKGSGVLLVGPNKKSYVLHDGSAFIIPANTWHQVINNSNDVLKLYTIYSPAHHPHDRIDVERPADVSNDRYNHFVKSNHKKFIY